MKFINSIVVIFENPKTAEKYRLLHKNGYIYKWSYQICKKTKVKR